MSKYKPTTIGSVSGWCFFLIVKRINYRKEEFDSSSLIEQLFEKLPIVEREKMLSKLNRDYAE